MFTTNNKSLPRAADPVSVNMFGDVLTSQVGSVACDGLQGKGFVMNPSLNGLSGVDPVAEAQDGLPVASGIGSVVFRMAAENAVAMGWMSERGFSNLLDVMEREGIQ